MVNKFVLEVNKYQYRKLKTILKSNELL